MEDHPHYHPRAWNSQVQMGWRQEQEEAELAVVVQEPAGLEVVDPAVAGLVVVVQAWVGAVDKHLVLPDRAAGHKEQFDGVMLGKAEVGEAVNKHSVDTSHPPVQSRSGHPLQRPIFADPCYPHKIYF